MVYNNCDIAVALTVACFINPDLHSTVQTDIHIRFEIVMDACDTSADGKKNKLNRQTKNLENR